MKPMNNNLSAAATLLMQLVNEDILRLRRVRKQKQHMQDYQREQSEEPGPDEKVTYASNPIPRLPHTS